MTLQQTGIVTSYKRWFVLATIAGSSFISGFNGSALNVAIPFISKSWNLTSAQQNMIVTLYVLSIAMFLVPVGSLSDRYGKKIFYSLGLGVFSLSALIIGFSKDISILLIFRVLQGIGASAIFSTSLAILSRCFPKEQRGFVLGINVTGVYLGLSSGPILGGVLTDTFGWKFIFYITAAIGLSLLVLAVLIITDTFYYQVNGKFDFIGTILYATTLFLLLYGFKILPAAVAYFLIAGSLVCFILFIIVEMRVQQPILDLSLFRKNKYFAFSNLTALTFYSSSFATGFLFSLYFQYIQGLSPSKTGIILVTQPLLQAISSPFAGRLSDIFEKRIIVSIGLGTMCVSLFAYIFIVQTNVNYWLIILLLAISGVGYGLFSSPNSNAIMSSVPKNSYGIASALVATMRTVGQTLSFGIATLGFALIIGNISVNDPTYSSLLQKALTAIFPVLFILALVSLTFSLLRGKDPTKDIE